MSRIESAQGMLAERFAFCQTMPLDEFLTTAEALRKSGYRPIRFRPYADGQAVRVAAVWTRDGRNWRIASGQTADEVRQQDERNRKEQVPSRRCRRIRGDGYEEGKPADRYRRPLGREDRPTTTPGMYVGVTADELHEGPGPTQGRQADPPDAARLAAGGRSHEATPASGARPPPEPPTRLSFQDDQFEGNFPSRRLSSPAP